MKRVLPPDARLQLETWLGLNKPEPHVPFSVGFVNLLATDPPMFLTGVSNDEYVGFAPYFARRRPDLPAGFIVFPTWSLEADWRGPPILAHYRAHMAAHPHHRVRYICNAPGEVEVLRAVGIPAEVVNQKITVSEHLFRPIPGVEVEFDAIYNARFVRGKRHWLTRDLESVAYLTYADPRPREQLKFLKLWRQTSGYGKGHVLLNPLVDGLPVRLTLSDVNAALARARVGLLLSPEEGASYAAVEYMLAGLPIVSTPSLGGRDAFFDPEYCLICDPTPEAVRDAVDTLKARNIPREYIRERTLAKLAPVRRRFLEIVDEMCAELGASDRTPTAWPFDATSGTLWAPYDASFAAFEAARVAGSP